MKEDIDVIIKRWKEIPVISSQIFMNQFPYIVAPWDHWNKVMDVLKSRDENEDNKIEEKVVVEVDENVVSYVECESPKETRCNEGEKIEEENDGYRTDVSEMKELDFDDKSVDWEQSDNEL
tara:strand:- start:452 stop:814 length:363 start_codon:yes stop_codon:yes gene_type:complete